MSQSHDLQLHIAQLKDIRNILNAMKNLAFIEIHKLSQRQIFQQQAAEHINSALLDFLRFNPELNQHPVSTVEVLLILGSERGFCGDFNDRLLEEAERMPHDAAIGVGNRLISRLPSARLKIVDTLAGANVSEEIPARINQLAGLVESLKKTYASFTLTALYHEDETSGLRKLKLWPIEAPAEPLPRNNIPPLFQVPPEPLFLQLAGQYWFIRFHQLLQNSLLAENLKRLHHLEGAVQHLDTETARLHRKAQIYRQEEITEEIEVILLNSDASYF